MSLLHPERFHGLLLVAGLIMLGFVCTSEATLNWLASTNPATPQIPIASHHVIGVCWSADSKTLLSRSRGNGRCRAAVHSLHSSLTTPVWEGNYGDVTNGCTLSPDGSRVLLATDHGNLSWLDIETWDASDVAQLSSECFVTTAVSHDGKLVAAGLGDGEIYVYGRGRESGIKLDGLRTSQASSLRFADDDRRLLAARNDGSVEVWDVETGGLLRTLSGPIRLIGAAFLPGGDFVMASTGDHRITIWDLVTGTELWSCNDMLQSFSGACLLDCASDGSIAVWSSVDRRIVIWDLRLSRVRCEIQNPSVILQFRLSPDGASLAVAGGEPTIRIYDTSTGLETEQIDTTP